jgi:23S rRNA U2552 (ribose-2'-O)-methylase RlmE/FtsJ
MTRPQRGDRPRRGGNEGGEGRGRAPPIGLPESDEPRIYAPLIYKFSSKIAVKEAMVNGKFSVNSEFPRYDYGFHYFIHNTKAKMEEPQFIERQKFRFITNEFEHRVDRMPEVSIETFANNFFGIGEGSTKPKIMSRGFYKIWEILMMFDIVPVTGKLTSVHLAEAPGAFIQAVILYREKYAAKATKGDTHYGISLHSSAANIPSIAREFMDTYKDRVKIHQTSSKGKDTDTGDLTKVQTILNLVDANPGTAMLVTADGGMDWKNENMQEQEAAMMLFGEICAAVLVQKTEGSFVVKFYEMFTQTTAKMLLLLKDAYKEVYIVKPFMSRESNSERYIVCKGFQWSEERRTKMGKKLLKILEEWNERQSGPFGYIQDLFTDIEIPAETITFLRAMNTEISNRQLIAINKMVTYINSENYYGDAYNRFRDIQINSSKYWTAIFLPEERDSIRKYMDQQMEMIMKLSTIREQSMAVEL